MVDKKIKIDIEEVPALPNKKLTPEERNNNFVMMYREHMPEIRWLTKQSGNASNILNFILEHMDYHNALVCPYQVFMSYFKISNSTVTRSIKLLKDNGFIDVAKTGTANVYIVNQKIAWTSYNNQKGFCRFDGNILISRHENADLEYTKHFERLKILRESLDKAQDDND